MENDARLRHAIRRTLHSLNGHFLQYEDNIFDMLFNDDHRYLSLWMDCVMNINVTNDIGFLVRSICPVIQNMCSDRHRVHADDLNKFKRGVQRLSYMVLDVFKRYLEHLGDPEPDFEFLKRCLYILEDLTDFARTDTELNLRPSGVYLAVTFDVLIAEFHRLYFILLLGNGADNQMTQDDFDFFLEGLQMIDDNIGDLNRESEVGIVVCSLYLRIRSAMRQFVDHIRVI